MLVSRFCFLTSCVSYPSVDELVSPGFESLQLSPSQQGHQTGFPNGPNRRFVGFRDLCWFQRLPTKKKKHSNDFKIIMPVLAMLLIPYMV